MTACHFSKEFEPGKADIDSVNAHWHGIIFMRINKNGSYKDTLDYNSLKALFDWANGEDLQMQIGNTQNKHKPITHTEDPTKAFLETAKYITKMPTKDTDEAFKARQSLIWEVSAVTHRCNFIKQGGELVKYKPKNDNLSTWVPNELKHHELCFTRKDYAEYLNDIKIDHINVCWFETIKIDHRRFQLDVAIDKLSQTRNPDQRKRIEIYTLSLIHI